MPARPAGMTCGWTLRAVGAGGTSRPSRRATRSTRPARGRPRFASASLTERRCDTAPRARRLTSGPHRKTPRRSTSRSTHCAPNAHESACHSAGARRGQRLPPLATPSARLMPCAQLLRCPRVSAVRRERGYRVCLDAAVERPSARPLRRRRISCVAIAGRVSIRGRRPSVDIALGARGRTAWCLGLVGCSGAAAESRRGIPQRRPAVALRAGRSSS